MFKFTKSSEHFSEVDPTVGLEHSDSSEFEVLSLMPSKFGSEINSHHENIDLSMTSVANDLSPEEVQTHLRNLLIENMELKDILHQNNLVMSKHLKHLSECQQQTLELQNYYKDKFEEARSMINKLREENVKLQDSNSGEVQSCQCLQPAKQTDNSEEPTLSLKFSPAIGSLKQLGEYDEKITLAVNFMEQHEENCKDLEDCLWTFHCKLDEMKAGTQMKTLQKEIKNLRQTLTRQLTIHHEDKKILADTQEKFQSLLRDYQALLKSWENIEHENEGIYSEEDYKMQIKLLNEQVDNLTAKLLSSEEAMSSTTAELSRLKQEMMSSRQQDAESVNLLQAQVEIYRADYEAEFKLKEQAQTEKQKLIDENVSLRLQLNPKGKFCNINDARPCMYHPQKKFREGKKTHFQKIEESTVSNSSSNEVQNNVSYSQCHNTFGARNPLTLCLHSNQYMAKGFKEPSESLDDDIYLCPKCNLGFTEFQPLENHVTNCLDKNDPFL